MITVMDSHCITLTHLRSDTLQAVCERGDLSVIDVERVVRAQIMAHRMEIFPEVRRRLLA